MKKILVILSEYGYWGEELVGPLEMLDQAGYTTVLATPQGKRPHALAPSMDPTFVDPPLGRPVVAEEMAKKVKRLDDSPRLDNPLSLAQLLPERPYYGNQYYLRELEQYNIALEDATPKFEEYSALLLIGGTGPIVDMVNNQRVHDLILIFHRLGKIIAAECYAVTCLAFARDYILRQSLIWGKHVTGHPLEYDYKNGTGFYGVDFNMGPPPYPLEFILRDAVGPDGQYHGNVGRPTSVIVDYPFVTARSTADSYPCGQKLIEVLEKGLTRWGW
jgi:putative intracellular protease/amidase